MTDNVGQTDHQTGDEIRDLTERAWADVEDRLTAIESTLRSILGILRKNEGFTL